MKKTLINEFTYGRKIDMNSNDDGVLFDEDLDVIVNIQFLEMDKEPLLAMYLNEEEYDLNDICEAEIDEKLKTELISWFEYYEEKLDLKEWRIGDDDEQYR